MSRAAGPQCEHVRGMPWSLCLTGGTSVSGALCLGMDQGVWCRWTVRVACLWLFGATSRMVGVAVNWRLVLARAGSGVLAPESLVRRVDVLGPRHVAPCLGSACAEVRLEDAACWPLRVRRERGVVEVALGHDLHLCWGDVNYGDGGSREALGVHLARRVSVDVGVRGHEWPLLIAGWRACGAVGGAAAGPRCRCPQRCGQRVVPVSTGGRCCGPFPLL